MDLRTGLSLWQGLHGPLPEFKPLEGDVRTEVAIIGGGVTGALLSSMLAQHGIEVLLVDKRNPATGSTAASTGLLQYEIDTPLVELIAKVGEAAAVHAYRRGIQAIDELEELASGLAAQVSFVRRKSLYLASLASDVPELRTEYDCRRAFGFEVAYLEPELVRELANFNAPGAILTSVAAEINPLALTSELLQRAASLGAAIHGQTFVQEVEENPLGVTLRTASGTIEAQAVIYATGYEASESLGFSPGRLRSTFALAAKMKSTATTCPPQFLLWETARPYFYSRYAYDNQYLVIGGEDIAGPEEHADRKLLAQKTERLVQDFERRFPECRVEPEYAWAGTFAETKDGLAYIGTLPKRERSFAALGYGGNGITFSMIAARLIRDLYIRRETPDAAVFSFAR
jgi:glycine/D-amino acid oxidase-like deaminating enzyme